jgi:hypothetical protein
MQKILPDVSFLAQWRDKIEAVSSQQQQQHLLLIISA